MVKFLKHPFVYNSVWITALYWILALFFSEDQMIQIVNYLVVSIAMSVIVTYAPAAWYAEKAKFRRAAILSTGVCLVALSAVELRGWSIVYRISGWQWMQDSYWIGFFIVQALWGYVHHIVPVDAIEQGIPGKSWRTVGLAFGAGMLAAFVLISFGFDKPL